jgi:hypothetical protein
MLENIVFYNYGLGKKNLSVVFVMGNVEKEFLLNLIQRIYG